MKLLILLFLPLLSLGQTTNYFPDFNYEHPGEERTIMYRKFDPNINAVGEWESLESMMSVLFYCRTAPKSGVNTVDEFYRLNDSTWYEMRYSHEGKLVAEGNVRVCTKSAGIDTLRIIDPVTLEESMVLTGCDIRKSGVWRFLNDESAWIEKRY